tara:strand:- start:49 stop:579 length:531 start_codon:yes stop_codon:yes gene_type:complete
MVNENLRGSRKMNHVVLDTNVVIDLFHVEYVKAITQLLKNRQNIIVCDTVLEEASRKLKLRPTTIKTKLEKTFGKRFNYFNKTREIMNYGLYLLNKYNTIVHKPDNLIIAIAKKQNADLITNDYNIQICCRNEKINWIDHRHTKLKDNKKVRIEKSLGNHITKSKLKKHSEDYYLK